MTPSANRQSGDMQLMSAAGWRSLLFVPANSERFVSKAADRGADAVILDLEDSVPREEKDNSRGMLQQSIAAAGRDGAPVLVRVNSDLRNLVADLAASVSSGVFGIVLPKVESADRVRWISETMEEIEVEKGLMPGRISLVLQIESSAPLKALDAIASADKRVTAIALGPEDFCASIGAVPCEESLLFPNILVLHAARRAGITPLGFVGSIAAYDDEEEFAQIVAQAKRLGFRGAMAVHPKQVALLNRGFAPTEAEIDWATEVISAEREARAQGRAAFVVGGKMIDPPVVRRAHEIAGQAARHRKPHAADRS